MAHFARKITLTWTAPPDPLPESAPTSAGCYTVDVECDCGEHIPYQVTTPEVGFQTHLNAMRNHSAIASQPPAPVAG